MTDGVNVLVNKCNALWGGVVTLLSYVFGIHWILFVSFFALNVTDFVTGCMKSHILGKTNSAKGAAGAWKKLGYWILIALSFGLDVIFEEIGSVIGVDLSFVVAFGWFILSTLIINEIRSILENFIEAGFPVPKILTKGLEVANKALDVTSGETESSQENTPL